MDYGILEAGIRRSIRQMGLEDVDGKFTFPFIGTFNNRYFLYLNITILNLDIKAKSVYKYFKYFNTKKLNN